MSAAREAAREAFAVFCRENRPSFGFTTGAIDAALAAYEVAQASRITPSFQERVRPWMRECFGDAVASDIRERCDRFLEEALELVQSLGWAKERALTLVDYVYGRPAGEPSQEVGGVRVTLAALCLAADLDMDDCGETELARIMRPEIMEKIKRKQAAKRDLHSPLPGYAEITPDAHEPHPGITSLPGTEGDADPASNDGRMSIKPGDCVRTQGGDDALIYCTDAPGPWPIHGRVGNYAFEWTKDGKYGTGGGSPKDLIFPTAPAREPMRLWVNFYSQGLGIYFSQENAMRSAKNATQRVAVPFVEVMEP